MVVTLFGLDTTTFAIMRRTTVCGGRRLFFGRAEGPWNAVCGRVDEPDASNLGRAIEPSLVLGELCEASADLDEHTVNQFLARLKINHRRWACRWQSRLCRSPCPMLVPYQSLWQILLKAK